MFCVNCGKQIESHFKFCPYCATTVSTNIQPNSKNNDFEIVAGKLIRYTGSDVDVIIPNNVIEIGERAFNGLTLLKSVVIPDSVITIDGEEFVGAFSSCVNLVDVSIGNGLKTIKRSAFAYCRSLTKITIPDNVTKIEEGAFRGCDKLMDIKYSKRLWITSFVGSGMFKKSALKYDLCPNCGYTLSSTFFGLKCVRCNIKY